MSVAVESWIGLLAEALLNGLWQGMLLALAAWGVTRAFRGLTASGRYAVWLIALAAMVLLPLFHVVTRAPQPAAVDSPVQFMPTTILSPAILAEAPEVPPEPAPLRIPVSASAIWIVPLWASLAGLLLLRLGDGWRRLTRIKLDAQPVQGCYETWWRRWLQTVPSARSSEFRTSARVTMPTTVGIGKPAILFPERLLSRLTENEAQAVWLHEQAHLQRFDDWMQLGQRIIEALLFFHPAARWAGRQIDLEREIACDDWVVEQTGHARPYAACLAKLAEYASRHRWSHAPAMAADKKQIFRRVRMLMDKNREQTSGASRALEAAGALLLAALVAGMAWSNPLVVLADEPLAIAEEETQPTPTVVPQPPEAPASPVASPPTVLPAPAPAATPSVPQAEPAPAPPPPPSIASDPDPAPAPQPAPEPSPEERRLMQEEAEQMRSEMRRRQEELQTTFREQAAEAREQAKQQQQKFDALREVFKRLMIANQEIAGKQVKELQERIRGMSDPAATESLRKLVEDMQTETKSVWSQEARKNYEEDMRQLKANMDLLRNSIRELENEMRRMERDMQDRMPETRQP